MRIVVIVVLSVYLIFWSGSSQGQEHKSRPITHAKSILAVYTEDDGLFSRGLRTLIVAVWGDGHMVWSSDNLHGGGSYQCGEVAPEKVAALLKQCSQEKLFTDTTLFKANFGPDSEFTTLYVKAEKQVLRMSSWHELGENANIVATDLGLEPLQGRKRADVLKNVSPTYKRYRTTWDSLRGRILALKPPKSQPVNGKMEIRAGIVSWVEWQDMVTRAPVEKRGK